jgi:putative transposase
VWVTKYRYKVLQGPMRERIREIIMQTCVKRGAILDHRNAA